MQLSQQPATPCHCGLGMWTWITADGTQNLLSIWSFSQGLVHLNQADLCEVGADLHPPYLTDEVLVGEKLRSLLKVTHLVHRGALIQI